MNVQKIMAKWSGVVACSVLLCACANTPRGGAVDLASDPLRPPSVVDGVCRADGARFALDRPITAQLVEDARVRSGSLYVRILAVGESVPLEANPQRLNLLLDAAGQVRAVRCR